jgi:citryl-CoA lyase
MARKPRAWTTAISKVEKTDVLVRGYSLLGLMGKLPFAAATYLLVRGEVPTKAQARVVDAVLCSILDYSLEKSGSVAARFNVSANPSMVAGIATSILGIGEYTIAPEGAGRFIFENYKRYRASGQAIEEFATATATELRGHRVPGFGHPNFLDVDPRAQVLRGIAEAEGQWGEICALYEAVHRAWLAQRRRGGVCINLVGVIACVLAQMGFTPEEMTGMAVISTLPGTVAQISEELASGARIRGIPDHDITYKTRRRNLAAALQAAGW